MQFKTLKARSLKLETKVDVWLGRLEQNRLVL